MVGGVAARRWSHSWLTAWPPGPPRPALFLVALEPLRHVPWTWTATSILPRPHRRRGRLFRHSPDGGTLDVQFGAWVLGGGPSDGSSPER
jgi:hypothetical protein